MRPAHATQPDGNLPRAPRGFAILEFMLAAVVVAILAGIGYPSYVERARKSQRADASLLLTATAARLERCFAECNSYTAQSCGAPCPMLPLTSSEGHYRIDNGPIKATAWTLVATPVAGSSQASDAACTSFTLTSQGTRSATGSAADTCWR